MPLSAAPPLFQSYAAHGIDEPLSGVENIQCLIEADGALIAGFRAGEARPCILHAYRAKTAWDPSFLEHIFMHDALVGSGIAPEAVAFLSKEMLVLPGTDFILTNAEAVFRRTSGLTAGDIIITSTPGIPDVRYMVAIPADYAQVAYRFCEGAQFLAAAPGLKIATQKTDIPLACLLAGHQTAVLTVLRNGKLLSVTTVPFEAAEDLAFAIAQQCGALEIPLSGLHLQVATICPESADIPAALAAYFPKSIAGGEENGLAWSTVLQGVESVFECVS